MTIATKEQHNEETEIFDKEQLGKEQTGNSIDSSGEEI